MRVLFFYPEINVPPNASALLEMGVYAAGLRAQGDEPRLAWYRHLPGEAEFAAMLDEARPHVFFAWMTPGQFGAAKPYLYHAKKNLAQSVVVAGGPLPGLIPDEVINLPGVDAMTLGEADGALAAFLAAWRAGGDIRAVDNFWMKTAEGEIIRRPLGPLAGDLDARPRPDAEFLPYGEILRGNGGLLPVRAGMGAGPIEAAMLESVYRGRNGVRARRRSPGAIAAEVVERFDPGLVSAVEFVDEAFPSDAAWLREFCDVWRGRVNLPFRICGHAEDFEGAALHQLRESGCDGITIEIVAGREPWRRTGAAGNFSERDLFARMAQVQSAEISLRVVSVLGHPEANMAHVERSLKLVRQCDPAEISLRFFDPLPGTPAWQECRRAGMMTERERFSLMPYRSTLRLPAMTDGDLLAQMEMMHAAAAEHAANRLKRMEASEGYFDFLQNFAEARLTARNKTLAGLGDFTLEKQQRPALWQWPGTEIAFDIPMRAFSHLCFGVAIEPDMGQRPAGDAHELEIELTQSGAASLVFHKLLTAKEAVRWFDYSLPLSDALAGPARLTFRLKSAGAAAAPPRRAFWSRPFLTDRTSQADRGQKSSTADISKGAIAIQRTVIEKQERELEEAERQMHELRVKADLLQQQLDRRLTENEALRRQIEAAIESITRLQEQLEAALPIVEKHNKSIAARFKKLLGK